MGKAMLRASHPRVAAFIVVTLVLLIYVSVVYRAVRLAFEPFDSWQTGDWLINYSGGFVRRGLAGTVIFAVTPSSWSLPLIVVFVQVLILAIVYICVMVLFLRTDRSPAWIMVILSPATLLFPLLNPLGGLRKEVFALAVVALVAVSISARRPAYASIPALVLFVVAVLSHEASVLVLPSILLLMWWGAKTRSFNLTDRVLAAAFVLVALIGMVLSLAFRGTPAQASAISASWAERGITWSGGALEALVLPAGDALEELRSRFPEYWDYLPYLVLALLPLYAIRFLPQEWRIAGVVALATLPLFFVAWDYGRWIYLGMMQLSLIALVMRERLRPAMKVPVLGAVAFALLWGMGFHGNPTAPSVFDLFIHAFQ